MKSKKTRERILDTSLELFNEKKASNVSTVQISAAMKISPGNLYYYYANKEDVIRCLWEERISGTLEGLLDKIGTINTAADTLDYLEETIKYMIDYRFFYTELSTLFANDEKLVELYHNTDKKMRGVFADYIIRSTEEGKFVEGKDALKVMAIQNVIAIAKQMIDKYDVYTAKGVSVEDFIGFTWIRIVSVMDPILVSEEREAFEAELIARGYNMNRYLEIAK